MAAKELLSAFVDGEVANDALIVELEQSPENQETWKTYHLIGDTIRGDLPKTINWNIVENVSVALDAEPAHQSVLIPLVEPQPTPKQVRRQRPAWLVSYGQVGVAACAFFAIILGFQQYRSKDSLPDLASEELPVLQTVPFSGRVEPVSLTRKTEPSEKRDQVQLLERRRHTNAMLKDYELQLRLTSERVVESRANTQNE